MRAYISCRPHAFLLLLLAASACWGEGVATCMNAPCLVHAHAPHLAAAQAGMEAHSSTLASPWVSQPPAARGMTAGLSCAQCIARARTRAHGLLLQGPKRLQAAIAC